MNIETYTEGKIKAAQKGIKSCLGFLQSDDAKSHRNLRLSTQRRFANLTEIYDRLTSGGIESLTSQEVYYYNTLYKNRDLSIDHVSAV